MVNQSKLLCLLLSSVVAIPVSGCGRAEPPPPPAAQVSILLPLERRVIEWDDYPGQLESPKSVTLAARVSGIILQAPFEEGALVNEGDVIFVIDDRPYKADLASKAAAVAKAQAQAAQAQVHFNRYSKIRGTRAISAEDYDQAVAALRQAQAELEASKAAEEIAKMNAEWTKVKAPITGKISRKLVTEGNLVNGGAGQATPLTTINSVDPLYCTVNVPENAYLRYQTQMEENKKTSGRGEIPCTFRLENETDFARKGFVDFIDSKVDRGTGTILVRGVLPNPSGTLASGLFARMRIPGGPPRSALLVPDIAINTDQNSRNVLVVRNDDVVEQRKVKLGALLGRMRVVSEGLNPGERVIINGVLAARPGAKVAATGTPVPADILASLTPFLAEAGPQGDGAGK